MKQRQEHVKREWDKFDMEAERESKHAPGHYGKRQATRKGLVGCNDEMWEALMK